MLSRNTFFVVIGGGIAVAIFAALFWSASEPRTSQTQPGLSITPTKSISIDGTSVHVAVVDTQAKREQGLSGVSGLAQDEGMLFVFEEEGNYSFWMKDMLFSIDMLWISSGGRVVSIQKDASPDSFPQSFTSDTPARYVLEVPAGFSEKHRLEEGKSIVTFD